MRKFLIRIIEWNAKRQFRSQSNLSISDSARVCYRKLKLSPSNRLTVGERSTLGASIAFEKEGAEVVIGNDTFVGNSHIICATRVEIGDNVLVAWGCTITDHNSHAIS